MRVVLDTSVLVSALISNRGTLGQVLQLLRDERFELVYSRPLIFELIQVLQRPKIRDKYHIGLEEIRAIFGLIRLRGELVSPRMEIRACRDPKDDKLLEAAIEGHAEIVVTGDADLIALHPFEGIEILSPKEFINRFILDE